nr:GIY-YIG nuclease family protein [Bacteroidota bacterium]
MKPIGTHNYFVYIVTNKNRTVLYTGVTNDLERRLYEHEKNSKSINKTFTGRYNAYFLIYWESFQYIQHAIEREKEIKGWTRLKKENLINGFNPDWKFLNDEI